MKTFLIIYDHNSGIAELSNVGIFKSYNKLEAIKIAKEQWNTTASLKAFDLDECQNGWSYYT